MPIVEFHNPTVPGWRPTGSSTSAPWPTPSNPTSSRVLTAAQARLTTLGEVASALAHQLNQPLTAIAGYNAGVLRSLQDAGYADAVV